MASQYKWNRNCINKTEIVAPDHITKNKNALKHDYIRLNYMKNTYFMKIFKKVLTEPCYRDMIRTNRKTVFYLPKHWKTPIKRGDF